MDIARGTLKENRVIRVFVLYPVLNPLIIKELTP